MARRKLTQNEHALWQSVAASVTPKRPALSVDSALVAPEKQPHVRSIAPPSPSPAVGAQSVPAAPSLSMDHKLFKRMSAGKLKPEARLDLHGMTLDRAQAALTKFVLRAHAEGRRLVLVITGKGRSVADEGPIPVRRGVIRQSVPEWCARPPLRQVILELTPAHRGHGGEGAYYIYLKRI